jgi:hypothetical protein
VAGAWELWGRFYYPGAPGSNDANSFFARVDASAPMKLGNNQDYFRSWHWDGDGDVEVGGARGLSLGFLEPGDHVVVVEAREVEPMAPRIDLLALVPAGDPPPSDAEARAALGLP